MGYDAAEQAMASTALLRLKRYNEHLTEQPNDPRAVLLQAYIHFYAFKTPPRPPAATARCWSWKRGAVPRLGHEG